MGGGDSSQGEEPSRYPEFRRVTPDVRGRDYPQQRGFCNPQTLQHGSPACHHPHRLEKRLISQEKCHGRSPGSFPAKPRKNPRKTSDLRLLVCRAFLFRLFILILPRLPYTVFQKIASIFNLSLCRVYASPGRIGPAQSDSARILEEGYLKDERALRISANRKSAYKA